MQMSTCRCKGRKIGRCSNSQSDHAEWYVPSSLLRTHVYMLWFSSLGGVTTDGGKTWALNVIPIEAEAGFDVRIPPTVPLEEFEAKMKEWYRLDHACTTRFMHQRSRY